MTALEEMGPDFFQKGVELHNKGDFQEAIEMYKRAMEIHGLDKKTLVLLGNAYYSTKEYKEADAAYKKALSIDPNYAKAHFNLGIIYEETKKYKEAIAAYKKAIELEEGFAEAYSNLGDAYKALRDMDNAILNYQKALEIDSSLENAKDGLDYIPRYLIEKAKKRDLINKSDQLIREGIELEKKEDLKGAVEKYKSSMRLFPDSAAAFLLLKLSSSIAPTASKSELGFLRLNSAVIVDSISLEVREYLGKKLGMIDLESMVLERFFNGLREIVNDAQDTKIDILKTSRSLLFQGPEKELSDALDLELKGDLDGATAGYNQVLLTAPYLTHAYLLFGIFFENQGNETEAFLKYKDALQYNLDYLYSDIWDVDLSELFSRRPGYEYLREMDVVSLLKEFLETTAKEEPVSMSRFIRYKLTLEAEAKIKFGFEKEERGESLAAINAYEDAINIDPSNPIGHYVLGLAYESRGLEKEAMEEYEKTRGADFRGLESSEEIPMIIEEYLSKTTKDGHRVGTILSRYFEIIAEDPEHMLELLGFIEDLKIESISKIIKSYISSDMILGTDGKVVRDQLDFGGMEEAGGFGVGKVVRDGFDFGEDLDKEKEKIERSKEVSKISFELLWKYKTQRSIRSESCTSDGKVILAGSENGIVYFIDEKANSPWRYESKAGIADIDVSPDGRYGIFCNSLGTVELLDCKKTGAPLWKKDLKKAGVNAVAISKEGGLIALATNNFEIKFFDLLGNVKKTVSMDKIITSLEVTDDGKRLLAASLDSLFIIEEDEAPKRLNELSPNENIQSISISKKGDLISLGTREGSVYLLDGSGAVIWKKDILTPVYGVSVDSSGNVVTGAMNGTIVLFSKEGEQLWKYMTGENIWDVDISEKGDRIISGCGLVFGNIYLFTME